MNRRHALIRLGRALAIPSILVFAPLPPAQAARKRQKVNREYLENMLTKGLRANRDEQKQQIAKIIIKVEKGEIPLSTIYAAYRWARKRRPDYPFPYFVAALRKLNKNVKW